MWDKVTAIKYHDSANRQWVMQATKHWC